MKKRVLFLTAFVPNPAAAAEKNTMILLEELSQNFDVDLVYFKYDDESDYIPKNNIKVVGVYKNNKVFKILNVLKKPYIHPIFTVRYSSKIKKSIQKLVDVEKYDAIITEHSQMFMYAKKIIAPVVKILYTHDVMAQRVERTSNRLIALFCKYSEKIFFNIPNSILFTISKKDAILVNQIYNINCRYALAYIEQKIKDVVPTVVKEEYCFIGKWSRADNLDGVIWFYEVIVPYIKKPIVINIIGKNFPKDKISCNNPLVTTNFTGFVENPYPLIAKCRAMLAPLFTGAGVKQKVFESIACGTPVIGTEITFEGLPKKYANMMLLANDADSYIKAMEVDIPVEERKRIRREFIEDYSSESIPQFLLRWKNE